MAKKHVNAQRETARLKIMRACKVQIPNGNCEHICIHTDALGPSPTKLQAKYTTSPIVGDCSLLADWRRLSYTSPHASPGNNLP